ncbi:MAG TPA: ABC transporter substrate-binding protein [Thermotogota bacterium]|nr:ABC transporter substrate-binding protein [Thermotogota bacterium]
MKKRVFLVLFVGLATLALSVQFLSPVGPTMISVVGMLEQRVPQEIPAQFTFWSTFDQVTAELASGRAEIMALPVTLGATLYNRGIDVRLLAVTLWEGFYLVAPEGTVQSAGDLEGMQLYTPQGKGQTGDVLIRVMLQQQGLDPEKDVSILYATPPEIIGLMSAGKVKAAVLPEPFVSLALQKVPGLAIAMDMQKVWEATSGTPRVPITGIFVRGDTLEQKPLETISTLLALRDSIHFAMQNTDDALQLTTKYFQGMPVGVLKQSMTRSGFAFTSMLVGADEVKSYFQTVHELTPEAMPTLPPDDFYVQ